MEKETFEQKFKGGEVIHSLSHSFIPPGSQSVSANISLGLFCGLGRVWGGRLAHSGSWAGVSQQWGKNILLALEETSEAGHQPSQLPSS